MAMTETKRKYLLTIALLHKDPSHPFRPIDLAVRLGVSRASVSRMLLEFVKEGLLSQKVHSYQLSERGRRMLGEALDHMAHTPFARCAQLSAFDAQECCIALLCGTRDPAASQPTHERRQTKTDQETKKLLLFFFFADRVVSRFPGECSTDQLHDLRGGIFKRHSRLSLRGKPARPCLR